MLFVIKMCTVERWTGCGGYSWRPVEVRTDVVVCQLGRPVQSVVVVKSLRRRRCCRRRRRPHFELFHLVVALPFHASVLKPDLDLSLGETQLVGELCAASTCQIAIEVKLFLKLERLVTAVRRPNALRVAAITAAVCMPPSHYHCHHKMFNVTITRNQTSMSEWQQLKRSSKRHYFKRIFLEVGLLKLESVQHCIAARHHTCTRVSCEFNKNVNFHWQ